MNSTTLLEPAPRSVEPQRWLTNPLTLWICIAGLAAVFGYLFAFQYHHEYQKDRKTGIREVHLGDFPTFYQAAEYARQHKDIYTAGFAPKRNTDRPTESSQMYVYPPLIAFLYAPLTTLPKVQLKPDERFPDGQVPVMAARVSLGINTLMLIGSLLLAAKAAAERMGVRGGWVIVPVAFAVSLLNLNEMRNVLNMLETDALMLLLFTLALYWLDRLPIWAGLALAFAFNIKYLPIVILPYLLLKRRWKTAGAMVVGSVFFALLPATLLGWNENLRCLQVAFGGLLKWVHLGPATSSSGQSIEIHNIGDMVSLSATSAMARLLEAHNFSNVAIMAVAAGVGVVALAIVALMYRLNALSLWRSPGAAARERPPFSRLAVLEWAGLMTVALVFSPDTNTRHLLLAILVNTPAIVLLLTLRPSTQAQDTARQGKSGISGLPVAIGIVIILISLVMPVPDFRRKQFQLYGIPCWGLLVGYLMILWTGLRDVSAKCKVQSAE